MITFFRVFRFFVVVAFIVSYQRDAIGQELKKDYFGAASPGDWAAQELTSPDGSRSTYISQRLPDEDGRFVAALSVKVISGAGEGSESKTVVYMPADFNVARDWLSYGKFTEKMSMEYSGMVMPLDEGTMEIMRSSSKDYRGAVKFSGEESINGYPCDRYTYSVGIAGPGAQLEVGELWLNDSVPFGIVRQAGKIMTADGAVASSYDIQLTEVGQEELSGSPVEESEPDVQSPAAPLVVSLLEGYQTELFALDITAVSGTGGRKLEMVLRNKTDREITVKLERGNIDLPGSMPVEEVLITMGESIDVVLPSEESSDPIPVNQRGPYGPVEGTFTLSYYEGTAYLTGSVTLDVLGK